MSFGYIRMPDARVRIPADRSAGESEIATVQPFGNRTIMSESSTAGRKLISFALFAAIVAGLIWWDSQRRGEVRSKAHVKVSQYIGGSDGKPELIEYCLDLLDDCHEEVFDENYTSGSRRRAAKFDFDNYVMTVFDRMAERAKGEGRADAVVFLLMLKANAEITAEE